MAQRWYQKATVQQTIVGGIAAIVVALIPVFFLVPENRHLRDKVDNQALEIQRLEIQLAPFRALALQKYPGAEAEAFAKLATEVDSLKSEADRTKSTVRQFEAKLAFDVNGPWKLARVPGPTKIMVGAGPHLFLNHRSGDPAKRIAFYASRAARSAPVGELSRTELWVSTKTGELPAGRPTTFLNEYSEVAFTSFALPLSDLAADRVIAKFFLTFFINDEQRRTILGDVVLPREEDALLQWTVGLPADNSLTGEQ